MESKRDKNLDLVVRDNVFYGNNLLYFIYKKGVKIAKATYLITEIIKDREPIKWALRKAASDIAVIKDGEDLKRAGQTLGVKASNIKTLILLANFSKNVSDMNASVIVKECDEIHCLVDELESYSKQHLSLTKDFFGVENLDTPSPFVSVLEREKIIPQAYKGQIKDTKNTMSFKISQPVTTDRESRINLSEVKDNKPSRSDQILNIIRLKGEVMIKDISALISDCSEKTIQRELSHLLDMGKIKRTGDRRWSRYSLL